MTWTERQHLGGFAARDANHNSWVVREAKGTEPGPWRIYVNGAYKGRAASDTMAMSQASQMAEEIASTSANQRHAVLYARPR